VVLETLCPSLGLQSQVDEEAQKIQLLFGFVARGSDVWSMAALKIVQPELRRQGKSKCKDYVDKNEACNSEAVVGKVQTDSAA
jgi:hypothetical protein